MAEEQETRVHANIQPWLTPAISFVAPAALIAVSIVAYGIIDLIKAKTVAKIEGQAAVLESRVQAAAANAQACLQAADLPGEVKMKFCTDELFMDVYDSDWYRDHPTFIP